MFAIKKYFDNQVFERYADYTGLEFYYRLNNEFGSLSGPREVVLAKRALEPNGKSLDIIAKEVNLIGYYLSEIKAIGTHIFITNIPRNEVAPFMKYIGIDTAQKAASEIMDIKEVLYKYK